jgi:hypothetical protein
MNGTARTQMTASLDTRLADRRKHRLESEINTEPMRDLGESFFADYDKPIERDKMIAMIRLIQKDVQPHHQPDVFETIDSHKGGNITQYGNDAFDKSIYTDSDRFIRFPDPPRKRHLSEDPWHKASNSMMNLAREIITDLSNAQDSVDQNTRPLVQGLREMHPDRTFYPDANSTMRFTYGTVRSYHPADAVYYHYYTTLEGVMEKEDPTNYEFVVPEKLKELHQAKDYGIYGEDGVMKVCFLTDQRYHRRQLRKPWSSTPKAI